MLLAAIAPKANRQAMLFDDPEQLERRDRLNRTMNDLINRFGRGNLQLAASSRCKAWRMKRDRLSACDTTDWEMIPVVG